MDRINKKAKEVQEALYSFYDRRVNVSLKKDSLITDRFIEIIQEALEEIYMKGYKEGRKDEKELWKDK